MHSSPSNLSSSRTTSRCEPLIPGAIAELWRRISGSDFHLPRRIASLPRLWLAYSATILGALAFSDLRSGKLRRCGYAATATGWTRFAVWLGSLASLTGVGREHTWSHVPRLQDLFAVYCWPGLALVITAAC